MDCPNIHGLNFDEKSKQGIRRIREIQSLSAMLQTAIGFGTFANIFLGKGGSIKPSYDVVSQDGVLFAQALTKCAQNSKKQDRARGIASSSSPR